MPPFGHPSGRPNSLSQKVPWTEKHLPSGIINPIDAVILIAMSHIHYSPLDTFLSRWGKGRFVARLVNHENLPHQPAQAYPTTSTCLPAPRHYALLSDTNIRVGSHIPHVRLRHVSVVPVCPSDYRLPLHVLEGVHPPCGCRVSKAERG